MRVELDHLAVDRSRQAVLHDVSVGFGTGVTVLLGPNGAGKSTLLGALVGLVPVRSGTIRFTASSGEVLDDRRVRRSLGYVPKEAPLPDVVALQDVVEYAAWLQRVPSSERAGAAGQALAAVRLADRAGTPVNRLSGGMRRRALLACAVVHEPDLLICDEPTVGLDPEEQHAFRTLVREQGERRAVVLSTHILDEASAVADELVVLAEGRIAFTGGLDDFVARAPDQGGDRVQTLEQAYLQVVGRADGAW